ncbi:hypothetical protein K440DRAFT_642565 [Wilcoxina mikolae CBS 423.85]|nr:hypothetical protein K440DRAFT_642565 [Wilcoxina mikolae CBS 423.85]
MSDFDSSYTALGRSDNVAPQSLAPRPRIPGWLIFCGFVVTLPISFSTLILLALVFRNLVQPSTSLANMVTLGPTISGDSYYVDYSASYLLVISSWCATLGVLVSGFMMNLFSYVFANKWYSSSSKQDFSKLPTPLQLSISMQALCFGGISSLWKVFRYHVLFKRRALSRSSLKAAGCVLAASIFLGWAITAADTWLHTASSTVPVTITTISTPRNYSRGFSANCTSLEFKTERSVCLTYIEYAYGKTLMNHTEAYATTFNTSSSNRVVNFHNEYALLVPAITDRTVDFTATTTAIKTTCKLESKACKLDPWAGTVTSFDCNVTGVFPYFVGNIQNMTSDERTMLEWDGNATRPNSGRFATTMYTKTISNELLHNPEIIETVHIDYAAVMVCALGVYDAVYSQVNGTIAQANFTLTNSPIGKIVMYGISFLYKYWFTILDQEWMVATTAKTTEQMELSMSNSVSRIFTAMIAGIMEPLPTTKQWDRKSLLVAKIPKAPFWLLVVLCLAYTIFGAVVLRMAVWSVVTRSKETLDTHLRLNVEAICATAFEPEKGRGPAEELEDMFLSKGREARRRVVVLPNEMGGMDVDAVPEDG